MTFYCIYKITNKINGKAYIGQHKYEDESNPMGTYKGSGKILWQAYEKYGFDNFVTEVMYKRILNKQTVDAMEIWAIEKYKPEYNIAKGGSGGDTFSRQSNEWKTARRKQMSDYWKEHNPDYNPVSKAKMIASMKEYHSNNVSPIKGRKHTQEHNTKVSLGLQKFHLNNPDYFKGRTKSPEMRSKLSKTRKGLKWFQNGTEVVQAYECPEGYWPGHPVWNKGQIPWNKGKKQGD